ncbi:phage tail protein [uncultured Aliivibrio sp.]|uniref:phage tail protein n=1 Tax=uncultured Aliivibrio sp. TaxID=873085 RepID=UPI00261C7794|nr:phage tail protein [uncultured Aliivibrio sp.]
MKALQSLTDLFTQSVTDAKNVELWAENGQIDCTQGLYVDGFDIAYTVNINMSDVDIQPEILMMHLVVWLNKYDVDRETKGLEPPTFATQCLDNGHFDLKLQIDIKEAYSLEESATGVWKQGDVRHDCVSDFAIAVVEDELPALEFTGPLGDLPECS